MPHLCGQATLFLLIKKCMPIFFNAEHMHFVETKYDRFPAQIVGKMLNLIGRYEISPCPMYSLIYNGSMYNNALRKYEKTMRIVFEKTSCTGLTLGCFR